MTSKEQEELIQRVIYGESNPEDAPTFRQQFKNDPSFRQCYYDHVFLSTSLESSSHFQRVAMGTSHQQATLIREKRRIRKISLAWAAAAIFLIAVITYFTHLPQQTDPETAKLAFADGTRWGLQHDNKKYTEHDLQMHPGSTLSLEQGVAEVSFPSGIKVILSGNSQLTFHGNNRFHLDHGKVSFDIPEPADGIELTTPRIKVVDLGTKFGVISQNHIFDEVHVLQGKVEVTSRIGRKQNRTVDAGAAVSIDFIGRIKERTPMVNTFPWKLPRTLPHLHWSFDQLDKDTFTVQGEHPLLQDLQTTYHSPRSTPTQNRLPSGKYSNALSFVQRGDHVTTNYPGISGASPRTFSVWLRIPPKRYQRPEVKRGNWTSVLGWGRRHHPNKVFTESIQLVVGANKINPDKNRGRLVPILSFEGIWFEGQTHLADGQWHHVVWVFTGKTDEKNVPEVTCYCDGKLESLQVGGLDQANLRNSSSPVDTIIDSEESIPLTIGTSLVPNSTDEPPTPVELDELFVIEGVISPQEAQSLYEKNRYIPARPNTISVKERGTEENGK